MFTTDPAARLQEDPNISMTVWALIKRPTDAYKEPTDAYKETYQCMQRDLLMHAKRPTDTYKETY